MSTEEAALAGAEETITAQSLCDHSRISDIEMRKKLSSPKRVLEEEFERNQKQELEDKLSSLNLDELKEIQSQIEVRRDLRASARNGLIILQSRAEGLQRMEGNVRSVIFGVLSNFCLDPHYEEDLEQMLSDFVRYIEEEDREIHNLDRILGVVSKQIGESKMRQGVGMRV